MRNGGKCWKKEERGETGRKGEAGREAGKEAAGGVGRRRMRTCRRCDCLFSCLPKCRYQYYLENVLEVANEYQEVGDLLLRHATLLATNQVRERMRSCRGP